MCSSAATTDHARPRCRQGAGPSGVVELRHRRRRRCRRTASSAGILPSGSCSRSPVRWSENERVLHDLRNRTILLVGFVTRDGGRARLADRPHGLRPARAPDAGRHRRRSARDTSTSRCPSAATTRSAASATRSTACSARWPRHATTSAASSRTPATSCARRSRACARTSPCCAGTPTSTPRPGPRCSTTCTPRRRSSSASSRRSSPSPAGSTDESAAGARRARARWRRPSPPGPRRRHGRPVTVVDDGSVVEAPPPALERAISNLVDNAAKFDAIERADRHRDRRRPPRRAWTAGRASRATTSARVFDRFYRAEDARVAARLGARAVDRARGRRARRRHASRRQPDPAAARSSASASRSSTASTTDTGRGAADAPSTVDVPLEPASRTASTDPAVNRHGPTRRAGGGPWLHPERGTRPRTARWVASTP